ncbi:Lrp/AsnC family transcriptional regulator [Sphingomonas colocasiae]|uniref:Lrp/AsnC family transcriptional regulator n=1 Tax=Sphingomonas colocasiae TaxID=1848973 RepID=A0ABS7Q0Y9_9SPHN|nr:Lrp/AsnC family transcriptional regulator [Sphingomonas colocasiae]MBY8826202.1 Lrp/AsnC family transcriptional regulator [Sphingomonas colocasiae]
MTISLDQTDRAILSLLQQDGSLSIAELADRLGMTPPPCWRRVKRLKDEGVLRRQTWIVDPEAIGINLIVYATIRLAAHDATATQQFRDRIKTWPEVLECYILLGAIDVLVKIAVKDIKYYEEFFFKKLSQLPGVREVNSSVVVSGIKDTTALPLDFI